MEKSAHPLMAPHVPSFITRPGETDTLLVVMGIFLFLLIVGFGVLYFRLHALPEQLSHRSNNKAQFEIVAVLALLALFTHNNMFWVAALILAMVPLPDFSTPLVTMAAAMTDIARNLWHRTAAGPGAVALQPPVPAPASASAPASVTERGMADPSLSAKVQDDV